MRTTITLSLILSMIPIASSAALVAQTQKPAPPAATSAPPAAELNASDIYKKDLPSIVYIDETAKDGKEYNGSGYVALKDGYVVTCWHVVHDAKSVTVRFSDGQEFEATGLVDHDVKNDLALIKIRTVGRPLLPMEKDDPEIGANVYVIGAPLGLDFTISNGIVSQIRNGADGNFYQFTAAASPGNSGGPVVDATGQVIGLVDMQFEEGQNLNFAVPAKYALALDPTLPTKPWSDVVDDTPPDKSDNSDTSPANNDDLDKMIETAFVDAIDADCFLVYVENLMVQKNTYRSGVPPRVYSLQDSLKRDIDALSSTTSDDKARENLRIDVLAQAQHMADAADYMSKAILVAGTDNGWDTIANDLVNRCVGTLKEYKRISADEEDLLFSLQFSSNEKTILYKLLHDPAPSIVGFSWKMIGDPLFVCVIDKGSVAGKLGIRPGDTIVSVDGQNPADLADTAHEILQDRDKKVDIIVQRGDKRVELKGDVQVNY